MLLRDLTNLRKRLPKPDLSTRSGRRRQHVINAARAILVGAANLVIQGARQVSGSTETIAALCHLSNSYTTKVVQAALRALSWWAYKDARRRAKASGLDIRPVLCHDADTWMFSVE